MPKGCAMHAALYYPSISFNNPQWLLCASLLWDRIYRIVPDGVEVNDHIALKPLLETGHIGEYISPPQNLNELADAFLSEMDEYSFAAAFCLNEEDEQYTRLHPSKLDVRMRHMLDEYAHQEDGWYGVPTDFATHYMCYLANHIALKNNIHTISDDSGAWTSTACFKFGGGIDVITEKTNGIEKVLTALSIPEISPYNFDTCPAEKIVQIREKYADERIEFMDSLDEIYKKLSSIEHPDLARDYIEDEKKRINAAIKNYQQMLTAAAGKKTRGKLSILIPVATQVADILLGGSWSVSQMVTLPFAGVLAGAVCGLSTFRKDLKVADSSAMYLFSLQNEWRKLRQGCDYNYTLCRDMEEFIND